MSPQLNKKLNMTVGAEIRIVLNIYLEGDWTNNDQQSGGDQGPCNQDCEELNVTLWSGLLKSLRNIFHKFQKVGIPLLSPI